MPGFEILHEDAAIIVVNKPPGLLTQAPLGIDSLEVRIKRLLRERGAPADQIYLGVPHRIDRPASGVIVFAKTLKAAQKISRQFEKRWVEKSYWALAEGSIEPAAGTWTDTLKKTYGKPQSQVVAESDPDGQLAILHYQVVGTLRVPSPDDGTQSMPATLLEIRLETGRTHQIRVQCASRGHPLLGDELYGSKRPFGPWSDDERERLIALHARSLKLRHPQTQQDLAFTAPLPDIWRGVVPPGAFAAEAAVNDPGELRS
jgi:23S rRNA pseudouridine1911/1915/1917 synthase